MVARISNWLVKNPIPVFFLLTFVIAWSLWLPLGFLAPENYLLTLPGAWAPTISALILTGVSNGSKGVRQFLKKLLHWQVGLRWYLVVIFGAALLATLAIAAGLFFGFPAPELSLPDVLPPETQLMALPVIFLFNILIGGPLAEDIGWRGYLLPKMRKQIATLRRAS